ncbi:4711_t:CDS:1, partial [Acaulospora morrowiae]
MSTSQLNSLVSYKTMERRPHRSFVKSETQSLWRNKFKERCLQRIKENRFFSVNARRLDFWKISNSSVDEDE